ncbi:MAG: metallophosphoesterase, partial [Dehalococcoidales bacterium]
MERHCGWRMALYSAVLVLVAMAGQTMAVDPLIEAGSTWKYLDDGSNQGTAWRETGFDDSGWASGPAELGYGDGDEATVVSYGEDENTKYITTYFRHTFNVPDASLYQKVAISLKRDDGIVVYLNGSEIFRDSMPTGTITYTTPATQDLEDNYFRSWTKDAPTMVNGTNVLAVEIHQYNGTSDDISFDLSLRQVPVDVRKGPYLIYPGNNTEMMVLWQLEAPVSLPLKWGQDTNYSEGSETPEVYGDTQYRHTITGLTPGVKYYYEVQRAGSGSFFAAPPDDTANVKFLAFGDTRTNPGIHNTVNGAMINVYTSDPAYQTFTMLTGDWVNNGDSESDWTGQFFDRSLSSVMAMHANLPANGCIGNHEQSGGLYDKYWPYPYESGGRWWSFDYGPAHVAVVVLTSEYGGGASLGEAQKAWLEADLAASTKEWKFLQFHAPIYSAGGNHPNSTTEQAYIQNLCINYNVDMVFCGHNHYYAHCDVDDVKHITTGGGGAPLNNPNSSYHESIVAVSRTNHFCKIDIHGLLLDFEAVTSAGAVIDSFTLEHIHDTTAPTPDPMTWSSLPEGTNYDSISMTASTASDDNYDVEYYFECTAGAGHDSGWQDSPTYVDTGLEPGTQYTYRVKARDMSRKHNETGFSSAESATTHPPDILPPRPNPTTWAAHPESSGIYSISMAVVPATDPTGVEYYFECTGGGNDSGWQDSDVYEDTGLLENIVYTYRVKARDKSPNQNETEWSYEMSARTDINFPDPGDFNRDWVVNLLDLGLFGLQFGRNGCGLDDFWCNFADMDQSTGVDATDLWMFSSHWLEEYLPEEFELDFEDFESYPNGTILGSQPDWFTEGGTQVWNNGIGGSQGCTP